MKMISLFLIGACLGCSCMTCYDLYKENKYLNDKLDKVNKEITNNNKEVK